MRITTRLKLSTFLYLCVLIVMIPILVWAFIESGRATRNDHLASKIQNLVFEGTSLRDEYMMYNEARAQTAWHAKKDLTARLLQNASAQFTSKADKILLKKMKQNYDETIVIFSRIEKLRGDPAVMEIVQRS